MIKIFNIKIFYHFFKIMGACGSKNSEHGKSKLDAQGKGQGQEKGANGKKKHINAANSEEEQEQAAKVIQNRWRDKKGKRN